MDVNDRTDETELAAALAAAQAEDTSTKVAEAGEKADQPDSHDQINQPNMAEALPIEHPPLTAAVLESLMTEIPVVDSPSPKIAAQQQEDKRVAEEKVDRAVREASGFGAHPFDQAEQFKYSNARRIQLMIAANHPNPAHREAARLEAARLDEEWTQRNYSQEDRAALQAQEDSGELDVTNTITLAAPVAVDPSKIDLHQDPDA